MKKHIVKCRRVKELDFGRRLSLEVISIDGHQNYSASRKIYIDENYKKLYYKFHTDKQAFQYELIGGIQKLTINGHKLNICITQIEIQILGENQQFQSSEIIPEVGKQYRLHNGAIVKIIAFENDKKFVSEPTYIGIYLFGKIDGTVRYSKEGKLLSHDKVKNFEIVYEYKENKIWLVINDDGITCKVSSYYVKENAYDFAKKFGGFVKEIDLDEEKKNVIK
jgi:hypothetical protein